MILTQSYFLLTEGWRMFLPEGPLVDTTNRERLQLITRENGKSLSKSNQHVRKAHYGGFLLLNVNKILLINKVTLRLAILTISKLTGSNVRFSSLETSPSAKSEEKRNDVFAGYFKARILETCLAKLRTGDFFD